jgi:hypothetical protein
MGNIDPLDIPNMDEEQSYEYMLNELKIPITRRAIKWAVIDREVIPTRIGRKNLFSRRDWLLWLESRRQPGIYRAGKSPATVNE